jgi:hypothetical protein
MKATMDIAGAGKTAGRIMKTHATRYFSSTLKPWIQRQPNGWVSDTPNCYTSQRGIILILRS